MSTDAAAKRDTPQGEPTPPPRLAPPRMTMRQLLTRVAIAVFAVVVLGWSYDGARIDPVGFVHNAPNLWKFLKAFGNPDFARWRDYQSDMIVTIQIAVWGTFLAVALAVPCGLLSASNVAPWWVHQPMRRLMDTFRAINEIVFGMLFIAVVGPGPFAGVLALFIHTLGTLAKLFSEAVEAIDPRPVEGIRATGGSAIDEINFGVIPQVMPLWVSYTLYRFEANVRSATVLGLVGAGGIGLLLNEAIRGFQYAQSSAILIIIVITVILLDLVSSLIRKYYI